MQKHTTITEMTSKWFKKRLQAAPVKGQFVYIRVHTAQLQQNRPAVTDPTGQHSSHHLYLIKGTFEDIARFSGTTVDWIIKIAHLLCDPLGTGHVFTHTSGTPSDWYSSERTSGWREVVRGDRLLPGIYEFDAFHPFTLSKISDRRSRSLTTPGSEFSASTFRSHVFQRDAVCVVTESSVPLSASHLIPKRIGFDGIKAAAERFVGVTEATGMQRYDPRIGITLAKTVDGWVDCYEVGFYHVVNDTYALHNFSIDAPDLSILGLTLPWNLPQLHNHSVALSVHAGDQPLPPLGVFNWHYLQCVIRRFGTPEYNSLPDIRYSVFPFRTVSDSSDHETESSGHLDANPPYPSYRFERYLQKQMESQRDLEHREEILQWASGVPSGISVPATPEEACKEGDDGGTGAAEE